MQREFYEDYYPVLMRIGIRYADSRQDAEQWVHDGFLKIFQGQGVRVYALQLNLQ